MAELWGLLLRTGGELLDTVVDYHGGFAVEVDELECVVLGEVGDECDEGGAVAFVLQPTDVFALFEGCFFVDEVYVVDGKDVLWSGFRRAKGGALVDGVPKVEVGEEGGEESVATVGDKIVDLVAEDTDEVFGNEEGDVERV